MSEIQTKKLSSPSGYGLTLDPANGAVTVDGSVSATSFIGDGSLLTSIAGANKAFINWNTSLNTIYSSSNVSSVTSHGAGEESVSFSTSFVDANYAVVGSWSSNGGDSGTCTVGVKTVSPTGSLVNKTSSVCRIVGGGKYGYATSSDSSNASLAFYR